MDLNLIVAVALAKYYDASPWAMPIAVEALYRIRDLAQDGDELAQGWLTFNWIGI